MPEATYRINEMFYSVQGEGMRAGTANVFVRFSGCNMECREEAGPKSPGGFDCDTEFVSGKVMNLDEIHREAVRISEEWTGMEAVGEDERVSLDDGNRPWQILTGGEPGLQVDISYCEIMHRKGWNLAIETNGSIDLPHIGTGQLDDYLLDWITVSPKVAEHAVRQLVAHEVKYVRGAGQAIPKPKCNARHQLISPVFNGMQLDQDSMETCLWLVKANPPWRLSVQAHKAWRVR